MTRNNEKIEVVTVVRSEESDLIRLNYEPGMSVSLVARQHGVAASELFIWRKLDREGALTTVEAGESVVPASELAAARAQIAQLQRLPGNKTMENEILKEAVELARERKWIARSPLLDKDGQRSRSARLSGWRARMCMN